MKIGDVFMIQFCAEFGSFRVLPLRTCVDLAKNAMDTGEPHNWVIVGYAHDEGDALAKMKGMRKPQIERKQDEGS